jgi:hypothetical protein
MIAVKKLLKYRCPDNYCVCFDYRYCHSCQIDYMDIKNYDVLEETNHKYRSLPSNPLNGVVKSK